MLIPNGYTQYGPVVPGVGPVPCPIMFIGEAPGEMEMHLQEPFVGRSGKRLTSLITYWLGMERSDVYLTNVVKFRPPDNRDPKKAEINDWLPALRTVLDSYIVSPLNIGFEFPPILPRIKFDR